MGRASQDFDRQLFILKLSELSRQMQIRSVAADRKAAVAPREAGGSFLVNMVDGQLALLREWLEGVDRICREVWQTQGEAITPEFVREILTLEAMTAIGARVGVTSSHVDRTAKQTREDPYAARHHLAMEVNRLKAEVANRYEIEARELGYQTAPAAQGGPKNQLDEMGGIRGRVEDATRDAVLWLQATPPAEERAHVLAIQGLLANLARIIERRMERRGPPEDDRQWSENLAEVLLLLDKAREVRGNIVGNGLARLADHMPKELPSAKARSVQSTGIIPGQFQGIPYHHLRSSANPTDVPSSPPTYFPSDLWPRTNVILLEARKKFPYQTQTLELCRHITLEMTPFFCEAVKAGRMKADAVLREGLGGMEDLLRFLLVHNDDGSRTGFGLSDQAYRLGRRVRQSDEWLALARAIADAQHDTVGSVRLRTGSQSKRSKPTNTAGGNTREAFLRPILDAKGFSVHDWASRARVDFHTANDYLTGKTKPHAANRKKLADALAIEVAKLPK
jgi:hypothetical protein